MQTSAILIDFEFVSVCHSIVLPFAEHTWQHQSIDHAEPYFCGLMQELSLFESKAARIESDREQGNAPKIVSALLGPEI